MSQSYRVAVLVGSLRRDSYNRLLARALEKLAPAEFRFEYPQIDDLPLYNQDLDADMPAPWRRLKGEIEAADALLFVTPEYNRSVPGMLKNAIDIASRPYGKNSFAGKPAGVIGTSVGSIGTALAQQHLRNTLAYLDVPTLGQPEAFVHFRDGMIDPDANVTNEATRKLLQTWVDAWAAWVRRLARS
jgi:chromate reductase